MKTKIFFIAVLTIASLSVKGQIKSIESLSIGYGNNSALSIPKEFSYTEKPLLYINSSSNSNKISIYDENIDLVSELNTVNVEPFQYTLTYQIEEREVTSIDVQSLNEESTYKTKEKWLEEEKMKYPDFSESWLKYGTDKNGEEIFSLDYSFISNYYTNTQMYFGYETFGFKYPMIYWKVGNDNILFMYRCSYKASYTDWKATGTYEENHTYSRKLVRLNYLDINNGSNVTGHFLVTQTLFNNDDKFEYIIPKLSLGKSSTNSSQYDSQIGNNNELTLKRKVLISENSDVLTVGFQVLTEEGTVIKDIDFGDGFGTSSMINNAIIISIGDNTYLAFTSSSGSGKMIFYKLDKTTNSIQKVKAVQSGMLMSSAIVDNNSSIKVTFTDKNVNGSQLRVFSASGAQVSAVDVPAGQQETILQLSGGTGVYFLSRFEKGKTAETKKFFIK